MGVRARIGGFLAKTPGPDEVPYETESEVGTTF